MENKHGSENLIHGTGVRNGGWNASRMVVVQMLGSKQCWWTLLSECFEGVAKKF